MGHHAAILLHRYFLDALSTTTSDHLSTRDVSALTSKGSSCTHDAAYATRYLLGEPSFCGILRFYRNKGWDVEVIEEERFIGAGLPKASSFDLLDVQLATRVPCDLVVAALEAGMPVVGWAPPELGSKQLQTLQLACSPETAPLLPRQVFIPDREDLGSIGVAEIESWFPADHLIAKSFSSACSRMADGSDYLVFRKRSWDEFVRFASTREWWPEGEGVLVSEMLRTDDPHLDNRNHVMHKVHLTSGFPSDADVHWPMTCRRMAATLQFERIGDRLAPLDDVLRLDGWRDGSLEMYRTHLLPVLGHISPLPALFSIDLMIPPDGMPRWLECNKLAGSFLDGGGSGPAPLERYLEAIVAEEWEPSFMLREVKRFMTDLALTKERAGHVAWVGEATIVHENNIYKNYE